jgi:adenylosuccinate synthase
MNGWMEKFLVGVNTLGVICTQWGDTGKGKFVDLFANWADLVARGTGGANAGHTIEADGKKFVCHLLPSGILHDKPNIIGSGVALEPGTVLEEVAMLEKAGERCGNLRIALNAKLVLPQHVLLDRVKESSARKGKIGTTGRGMGPVYTDHVARLGLTVNDLLNKDIFARKLWRNLEDKLRVLRTYDPSLVKEVLHQEILGGGKFYHPTYILDVDAIVEQYLAYGRALRPFIADTDALVREAAVAGKRILLEGAQGNMLSVDHGTYPYVTSSDCTVQGLAKGVGLRERDVDLTLGIVKAFYMTRVGEGPFPTELGGGRSAEHCDVSNRKAEEQMGGDLNDPDEFKQGIAIRQKGNEYGATTGRPRRTGWLDLPNLRYSKRFAGPNVILTKLDVLDGAISYKICTAYTYTGPDYVFGERTLRSGDVLKVMIPDIEVMRHCEPVYEELPGWDEEIRHVREYADLPDELRVGVDFTEEEADVNVSILSVGPDREETIFVKPPRKGE